MILFVIILKRRKGKMEIVYKACDGQIFNSEDECIKHETILNHSIYFYPDIVDLDKNVMKLDTAFHRYGRKATKIIPHDLCSVVAGLGGYKVVVIENEDALKMAKELCKSNNINYRGLEEGFNIWYIDRWVGQQTILNRMDLYKELAEFFAQSHLHETIID